MRQMRQALRKVTQHLPELWVVLLRKETEVVGAAACPLERLARLRPPALMREALRQPERARHEDALGSLQSVLRLVALHQSVEGEVLTDGIGLRTIRSSSQGSNSTAGNSRR